MSARVADVENGLVTVRITGKLTCSDMNGIKKVAREKLHPGDRVRVLVLAEDFEGWEKGGNWGDVSFQAQFDGNIEKMAIVGEQQWEETMLLFTAKGLRRFPIEYFLPQDMRSARQWLAEEK